MNSLLVTILLVLPGFVTMMIVESIGPSTERTLSDLERTLLGVLFTLPSSTLSWFVMSWIRWQPITSMNTFITLFSNVPFDLCYVAAQLAISWWVAHQWVFRWRVKLENHINWHRAKHGLQRINHRPPYEEFFSTAHNPIIEIVDMKTGRVCHRGIVHRTSSMAAQKHMIAVEDDYRLPWLDHLPELRPRKTLVMLSDGLELRRYEADDLREAIEEYQQKNKNAAG